MESKPGVMSRIANEQLTEEPRESCEVLFQWTLTKSDNDQNLMFGVYLSIKTNSLTGRNISFDLCIPLRKTPLWKELFWMINYLCLLFLIVHHATTKKVDAASQCHGSSMSDAMLELISCVSLFLKEDILEGIILDDQWSARYLLLLIIMHHATTKLHNALALQCQPHC